MKKLQHFKWIKNASKEEHEKNDKIYLYLNILYMSKSKKKKKKNIMGTNPYSYKTSLLSDAISEEDREIRRPSDTTRRSSGSSYGSIDSNLFDSDEDEPKTLNEIMKKPGLYQDFDADDMATLMSGIGRSRGLGSEDYYPKPGDWDYIPPPGAPPPLRASYGSSSEERAAAAERERKTCIGKACECVGKACKKIKAKLTRKKGRRTTANLLHNSLGGKKRRRTRRKKRKRKTRRKRKRRRKRKTRRKR